MRLFSRILLIALLPLVVTSLFLALRLCALVDSKEKELDLTRKLALTGIEARIAAAKRRSRDAVRILSLPTETAKAVAFADGAFLYRWGSAFLGPDLDMVIFSDTEGTILARAHDEYRFGDSYGDHPSFKSLAAGVPFYEGIVEVRGQFYLLCGLAVRLNGDRTVGYIVAGRGITASFLEELSAESEVDLTFPYEASGMDGTESPWIPGPVLDESLGHAGRLGIRYRPSVLADELAKTMRSSILLAPAFLLVMPVILIFFLFLYVKPYGTLTASLIDYSQHRIGLGELAETCGALASRKSTDAGNIAGAVSAMASRLQEYLELVERKNSDLERMSRRDALTGIANRLALDEILAMERNRSERYGTSLAVILADIDFFKAVNDELGHQEGDSVLKEISRVLAERARATDLCGRWGGEEFLIVCPHTDAAGAASLAEDMRLALETVTASDGRHIGASFGVAAFRPGEPVHSLVSRADKALYRAKESGRGRVVAA